MQASKQQPMQKDSPNKEGSQDQPNEENIQDFM